MFESVKQSVWSRFRAKTQTNKRGGGKIIQKRSNFVFFCVFLPRAVPPCTYFLFIPMVRSHFDLRFRDSPSLVKSSIDSGMQSLLYSYFPFIESFLHFHYSPGAIVIPTFKTEKTYPCGVTEEAEEVIR